MSVTSGLSRGKRLVLGICVLLLVDVIWVASSELTRYIFKDIGYSKPFFTTYIKTSMFMLYLLGFLFWKPWRHQCSDCNLQSKTHSVDSKSVSEEEEILQGKDDQSLSDPLYVPVKFNDSDKESSRSSSFSESNDSISKNNRVHFSNLMEVRHLSESLADEAMLARMSYGAAHRIHQVIQPSHKFTVPQVAKISFMFCIVWFLANFSYQEALDETQMTIVTILSSTSGLFTLVLAAMFPSSLGDKFTLTKFAAVLCSIGGIFLVSISQTNFHDHVKLGALWALCGAFLYAVYLVMLKRKVDHEDRLDIPMFFGFVGLFNFILIWPGLVALHYSNLEKWEMPSLKVWLYLAINGLVGTVLSEFLWLWGCFLTSSLIATLSLSLTIPITIIVDIFLNKVTFTYLFFLGAMPIFVSFFLVTILNHLDNWDPLWVFVKWLLRGMKKCLLCFCKKQPSKVRIPDDKDLKEQTESLIQTNIH